MISLWIRSTGALIMPEGWVRYLKIEMAFFFLKVHFIKFYFSELKQNLITAWWGPEPMWSNSIPQGLLYSLFCIILIYPTCSFTSDLKTQICMCTHTHSFQESLTQYCIFWVSVCLPLYKVLVLRGKKKKKKSTHWFFFFSQLTLSASVIIGGMLVESWAVTLKLE